MVLNLFRAATIASLAVPGIDSMPPVFAQAQAPITAIEHVTLIDGTGKPPRKDVTVMVEGRQIQSIMTGTPKDGMLPPSAKIVDAQGQFMMPGLINAHGHLAQYKGAETTGIFYTVPRVMAQLRLYEHYGVVDVLALGLNRDLIYPLRAQQAAGNLDGATVFVADRGIGTAGGQPKGTRPPDQLYQPKSPDEARRDVDEAAARHTNFIKIWVDDNHGKMPKMDPGLYGAVIDEAHKQHLPVAAHVYALEDAKLLVADGVDVLAHSVRDRKVDRELIAAMKLHGTFYIPTLTVDESFFSFADQPDLLNDPFLQRATSPEELAKLRSDAYRNSVASDPDTEQHRKDFAMAKINLQILYRAGVKVGFGTDSGAFPQRIPGYAEHREMQLMVEAGLKPMDVIKCATATNAMLLGIEKQTGTLTPGMRADFLLLDKNPLANIANTRRMVSIWHNGASGAPWVSIAQQDTFAAANAPLAAPPKKPSPHRGHRTH